MPDLVKSHLECAETELLILALADEHSDVSLAELSVWAPAYGARRESVAPSLRLLLRNGHLWPTGLIRQTDLLPERVACSPLGAGRLHDESTRIPPFTAAGSSAIVQGPDPREVDPTTILQDPALAPVDAEELVGLARAYEAATDAEKVRSRVHPEDLLLSVCRVYAAQQQTDDFARAATRCITATAERRDFWELAWRAKELCALAPAVSAPVLAAAYLALREPASALLGDAPPIFATPEDLNQCMRAMASACLRLGESTALGSYDLNELIGIANAADRLVHLAFETASPRLIPEATVLLLNLCRLTASFVRPNEPARTFHQVFGFGPRVEFAVGAALAIESCQSVAQIGEPAQSQARACIAHVVSTVVGAIVGLLPRAQLGDSSSDHDTNIRADLISRIAFLPPERMRREIRPQLETLVSIAMRELPIDRRGQVDLSRIRATQNELVVQVDRVLKAIAPIQDDVASLRWNAFPFLAHILSSLLDATRDNHRLLVEVCETVVASGIALEALDLTLSPQVEDIRSALAELGRAVHDSAVSNESGRRALVRQIGDLAKLTSAGKMILSVPLIPGIAEYRHETTVSVDVNAVFARLAAILKSAIAPIGRRRDARQL
ncbi:MAG: hypothetical protein U0575_04145 [Phycisphaerales bacterium]